MSSRRETLLAYLASVVATATAGLTPQPMVVRSRVMPFALAELPAIDLRPLTEAVETDFRSTQRSLEVQIEVLTRGAIPDQGADAIIVAIHAALLADTTLGCRASSIFETASTWTLEDADQPACALAVTYQIDYFTPTGDLTTLL